MTNRVSYPKWKINDDQSQEDVALDSSITMSEGDSEDNGKPAEKNANNGNVTRPRAEMQKNKDEKYTMEGYG